MIEKVSIISVYLQDNSIREKKMAFSLDKIKGLFIISEEDQQQAKKKVEEQAKHKTDEPDFEKVFGKKVGIQAEETATPPPLTKEPTPEQTTASEGEFNEKIFNSLTSSIQNANLPGEDYLEFVAALRAMESIPLEEKTKIQTVLATLSPRGLTLKTVFESADYYLKVLENEKSNFYEALKQQTQERIGGRGSIIGKLEQTIKDKQAKIAALEKEINIATSEITKIKTEIHESQTKIKKTENDFLITWEAVTGQIINNVKKIKQLDTNSNKEE